MLRYPGGKYKCRKLLHSLAPLRYDEYREPFLGGAGLLWDVPPGKRIWINDANPVIIKYYEALRDDDQFISRVIELRDQLVTAEEKRAAFMNAKSKLALEYDPLAYLIVNRFAAQALVSFERKSIASFSKVFTRDGLQVVTRSRMETLRDILRRPNCRLTCGDYASLVENGGDAVWLWLDPPYLLHDHGSHLYEFHLDTSGHRILSERLHACKHKWLMTIGDCRISRELYQGFRMRHRRYTCLMPHRTPDRNRTELIVMNY